MTRRPHLPLVGMLLLLVMCTAGVFLYVTSRVTERATSAQVDETLAQTQETALDALVLSAAAVDRAMDAVVSVANETPIEQAQVTMFHVLSFVPELSGVYVAGANGSFNYVYRTESGFGTKLIESITDGSPHDVSFTSTDNEFVETDRWEETDDLFDPRDRPWYNAASEQPGTAIWTDAYTFFTSQRPGVTLAVSSLDREWVVGIDLELSSFVQLLDTLSERSAGEVFLFDPEANSVLTRNGLVDLAQEPTPTDTRLRNAVSASAGKLSQGLGAIDYDVAGTTHNASFVPLTIATPNNTWVLVTDISDDDVPVSISGLVRGLQLLGLAVLAAAGIAGLLLMIPAARQMTRLQRQANIDPLTSLPNRRSILQTGEMASSSGSLSAVAMIDIDRFKNINDTYGHEVGDQALQGLANLFAESGCKIGRLGGEEFVMLIDDAELAEAPFAEMLRAAIELAPIDTSAGPIPVTVSIGVAAHPTGQDFTDTLRSADGALLEAKLNGRNRVVAVDQSRVSPRGKRAASSERR